ncbi:hypothetical protein ACTHUD_21180, partial [Neisseria sp. P0016.S002]
PNLLFLYEPNRKSLHFSVKSTKFLITYYKDLKSGTQTETAFRHLRSETQQAKSFTHNKTKKQFL